MKGSLVGILKKKSSFFQKKSPVPSKTNENLEESKNESPQKLKESKEEPKKEEKKEEEKKEDQNKKENVPRLSIKDKTVDIFMNILKTTKNESTLKEIYKSLETAKNFEMSALKNPPKLEQSKGILGLNLTKKQEVNYPLSAIGLLKCDYGNGLTMFGTGTLINLNMVITCAHVLYSPILKRRCESATFYLNLSDGKYLDSCKVETFVTPDEYEIGQNEQFDYALCVLGEDIGKKGGFLGLCTYNEKEDKTGYIYGYANKKSTNNFLSSFKTDVNEYEILGVKSVLRYIEDEKIIIYVGNKTKIGQDGSPIFKVIDDLEKAKIEAELKNLDKDKDKGKEKDKNNDKDKDKEKEKEKEKEKGKEKEKEKEKDKEKDKDKNKDKEKDKDKNNEKKKNEEDDIMNDLINNILGNVDEKRDVQKYDVKIFAIDCSMTSMVIQAVDSLVLDNNENIMLNEMIYVRNHKALAIDEKKFDQIVSWIKFYENIMPNGKIDKHIHKTKSVYNELFANFQMLSEGLIQTQQKENTVLSINCCDLRGKDLLMLLNSQFDISQLTIVDLSNNSINYEGMRWLTFQEELCENLIELNLSENILDHKAAKFLTKVKFNSLDRLILSKNYLGPLGISALSEKGKFPNLRELNISENYLMKEGAKGLANGQAFKEITSLDISGNDINDYGFYLLAMGNFGNISELYLSGNKIGDDGMTYISYFKKLEFLDMSFNALTYKGINNICSKNFKNIYSLNLDNNYAGIEGTYLIAAYKDNNLKKLSLVKNRICTKGAELISIMNLMKLESINISDNFINDLGFYFICKGKFQNLKELDVSLNRITDEGLVYLTEAIFLETLTLLNLTGNDITDGGVRYISFCKMPELLTLNLSVNYLKSKTGSYLSKSNFDYLSSLSLERNKIKPYGLENIITAKFFTNLVKLYLGYCRLGNEGCKILIKADVDKITHLSLKDNGIDDEGVIELCKGNWNNLKDLNLEDNDIGRSGINALVDTVVKQLSFLRLKGNKRIDNRDLIKIYNSVGNNDLEIDNEHKYTFLNFSQINYGAIRYCIMNPDFMKKINK